MTAFRKRHNELAQALLVPLVQVDIWVFEVSRIDDISLTMTFELYFDLTWQETRLVINDSSELWGPDGVMGSTNFVKSLWLPDIQESHIPSRLELENREKKTGKIPENPRIFPVSGKSPEKPGRNRGENPGKAP